MKRLIKIIFSLPLFFFALSSLAQAPVKNILTADSLKSGNAKDVLTSFFQLTFNRLTSNNKEVNFNANPFAIMLKSNPQLAVDTNYRRYNNLRKLNFGFGLRLDSAYRFNGFSSGIKYALVDKRDSSISRPLFSKLQNDQLKNEAFRLQDILEEYGRGIADTTLRSAFRKNRRAFLSQAVPYADLDTRFKRVVERIVQPKDFPVVYQLITETPTSSIHQDLQNRYETYRDEIKKGWLVTLGLSDTTYNDQFFFSNVLLNLEILKGVGKPKPGANLEINFRAALNFRDDSISRGRDLKRLILYVEPAINWVLRNKANDQSYLEFELGGSYTRNFKTLYVGERREISTLNATIRFRIFADTWIPLEIKYDPDAGNFLGFLNVRSNFSALGKLLNGKN